MDSVVAYSLNYFTQQNLTHSTLNNGFLCNNFSLDMKQTSPEPQDVSVL